MLFEKILFSVLRKVVSLLTEPLFFDTDCISAFLWVNEESILAKMFPGRIIIPKQVYNELSHPGLNHIKALKTQIDKLICDGSAKIEHINSGTNEYELYEKLTIKPEPNHKVIGKGEAAAIVLAKEKHGILASNNLKDIKSYVDEYELILMTTGDIMKKAFEDGLITEKQGNAIWSNMLAKKRKLGYDSFTEFLKNNKKASEEASAHIVQSKISTI